MGHSLPSCNQATPAAGTGIGSRSTAPCPGTTLEAGAADRWTMAFFPHQQLGGIEVSTIPIPTTGIVDGDSQICIIL